MRVPRFPLALKFLSLALLNLFLLGVVLALALRLELRQDFESFLLTTARERILAVSRLLALELRETPPDKRDELLARYSASHGVTFLLFDRQGRRVAGPPLDPPDAVQDRLERLARFPVPPRGVLPFTPPPFLEVAPEDPPYWVGVRIPLPDDAGMPGRATLLLASRRFLTNPFYFDITPWLWVAGIGVAVTLLCWLPLVRGLTKSIRQMMTATAAIEQGHFDANVSTTRGDELGHLGASINRMASRLRAYVGGQKRFLGDVAHELRSPLARMQLGLGILEQRAREEDREYIAGLREEVDTMSRLTCELLTFAKAELSQEPLKLQPINIAEVAQQAVDTEAQGHTNIRVTVDGAVRVLGETEYLYRALANLVRNAVRYAGDAGPIEISAARDGKWVVVRVTDSGPGIPESALDKIFTPFYRPESSRDRRTGGTGLGLAIVRSCVEACGGTVECRNRKPTGLEVSMRLQTA